MSRLNPTESANWMISFGDLLTLLVCFFMAMLQLGQTRKPSDIQDKSPSQQSLTLQPQSGTVLAPIGRSPHQSAKYPTVIGEVVTTSNDYVWGTPELNAVGVGRLRAESWNEDGVVEIESCGVGPRSWQEARSRAFGLRRLLLEAGVGPESITLRVVGPNCQSLKIMSPTTGVVLGAVRLIEQNG